MFAEFLEPLFHHAIYLRGVYDNVYFQETVAYETNVWQCLHPKVVGYIKSAVEACRRNIVAGKLREIHVCFLDNDEKPLDELCLSFAQADEDVVDETNALWYFNWFREVLLTLETTRSQGAAASFHIKLSVLGSMEDENEWLFAEGPTQSVTKETLCASSSRFVSVQASVRTLE